MGDLSKLNVAIGQAEIEAGRPSQNEAALERMIGEALDGGADVLAVPGSLEDANDIRLIGLNESRIDVMGQIAVLDTPSDTYRIAFTQAAADAECDFSVEADLSPYTLRPGAGRSPARMHAPRIVLRPVGLLDAGTRALCFDGGSFAQSAEGAPIARLRDDFADEVRTVCLADPPELEQPCEAKLLSALVSGLRRFDAQALGGGGKWVIGLSGGLDSSIVAALLVLAFGSERVRAYGLSTRFNSRPTLENARHVAEALDIPLAGGSIEGMVVALGNALLQYGYAPDALQGLALENAQARARAQMLSTFAALEGGVVVNNANRVESALGYSTLYGDSIGALAPIADITKVELFGLARDLNEVFGYEVVPVNLLPQETGEGFTWEVMPSAELASGQRDPMKWFYHDWLVGELLGDSCEQAPPLDAAACAVAERYLDDRLESAGMGKWLRLYGLDDPRAFAADLDWVLGCMRGSAFKRLQSPPKIALASPHSVAAQPGPQVAPEPSARYRALSRKLTTAR